MQKARRARVLLQVDADGRDRLTTRTRMPTAAGSAPSRTGARTTCWKALIRLSMGGNRIR